jgi:hypothetical protein
MAKVYAIARFTGIEDSVAVTWTGITSAIPIVRPGAAVVTGADGRNDSAPVINVVGYPTSTGCLLSTTGQFVGYVTVEIEDTDIQPVFPVPTSPVMYYGFDQTIAGFPGATLAPINGVAPTYQPFGRKGSSCYIPGTTGLYQRVDPGYPTVVSGNGWAWMGWVWTEGLSGNQGIIWQEGLDLSSVQINGVKIYLDASGFVHASIGAAGAWVLNMTSARTVGVRAWHHVALAWDGVNAYLYIDGVVDQTAAYTAQPQSSATSPVAFGAQYGVGAGTNVLNGAIDEFKFVTFPVSGGLGFILQQPWLAFRQQVIADLKAAGKIANTVAGENSLNSPTRLAGNILRAWVNSFITLARQFLPMQQYVYSLNNVYPIDGVVLAAGTGVNSTYLNLRDGATTAFCGGISQCLWGVYQAFGFAARIFDSTIGPDVRYPESHVVTECWMIEAGQDVIQDGTYNHVGIEIAGAVSPGKFDRILDIPFYSGSGPALPWGNDGFQYNTDIHYPPVPLSEYLSFFGTFVNIVPSYHMYPGE